MSDTALICVNTAVMKARKKKTSKKEEEQATEEVAVIEDERESLEKQQKPLKKALYLKQWYVTADDAEGKRFSIYVLATCGMKAREFFL